MEFTFEASHIFYFTSSKAVRWQKGDTHWDAAVCVVVRRVAVVGLAARVIVSAVAGVGVVHGVSDTFDHRDRSIHIERACSIACTYMH